MRSSLLIAIVGCVAGCASEMLEDRVIDRYWEDPTWATYETFGDTPGHGDSFRVIYANTIAQGLNPDLPYEGVGAYPEGSIIVKEVYTNDGGRPGTLQVIEVMRRDVPLADAVTGEPLDYFDNRFGWEFGATSTRNGDEADKSDFCWRRCHVNAPIAGAWFDYSKWRPVVP